MRLIKSGNLSETNLHRAYFKLFQLYFDRGNAEKSKGKLKEAVADFDRAIRLKDSEIAEVGRLPPEPSPNIFLARAYTDRGLARSRKGDHDGARADYNKAIAYYDQIIASENSKYHHRLYVDRALVKRLIRDSDGAIADLGLAIQIDQNDTEAYALRGKVWEEKGDIDRARADYSAVIATQTSSPGASSDKKEAQERLVALNASHISVPLNAVGTAFEVPVEINRAITLNFLIDSGATDVAIPADVVSTLIRTGTIEASDFIGTRTYVLADGSHSPSDIFVIRSLKVGNKVIENVRGSIAPATGTLLLGQSFLQHFKSWKIDNLKHELLLEPQ